ncbi:MAG: BlaI/MecI/CopY family transcriptional regulator [Terriglobales bacterium]
MRVDAHSPSLGLGPLESMVMEILWRRGDSNVRQVAERLKQPLAYTTVMTTLDRLYKKGLLERRKYERAFVYSTCMSHGQWLRRRAGEFVASFFAPTQPERRALLSCLLEAVEQYDAALLDELTNQISEKRRQLKRGVKA